MESRSLPVALVVVLLALLAACADESPAPVRRDPVPSVTQDEGRTRRKAEPQPAVDPPVEIPVEVPVVRDERLRKSDLGGWVPSTESIDRTLGLSDPERFSEFAHSKPVERIETIRTALRLEDESLARAVAFHAEWEHFDLWEAKRASRLMIDAVLDPDWRDPEGDTYGLAGLFELAGRDDLTYLLERLLKVPAEADGFHDLDSLHKLVHADHAPLVARLALSPHPRIREVAADTLLRQLVARTDRHRDHLAAAVLGMTVEDARRRYPTIPAGIDPLLEAVLRRRHLEETEGVGTWDPVSLWAWRWLAGQLPAERDLPFLLALGRAVPGGAGDHDLVAWHLRWFDDTESRAYLEERATAHGSLTALGALAVRGGADAERRLAERATDEAGALAVLLAARPAVGREVVAAAVFGDEPPTRDKMLHLVEEAWIEGPADTGVGFDADGLADLEARAFAAGLATGVLARIAVQVPGCRARRLAELAIARWEDTVEFSTLEDHTVPDSTSRRLGFLETAAPREFRARVLKFAESREERVRLFGLQTLLRIGVSGDDGRILVEWLKATRAGGSASDLLMLERSDSPHVTAFLREELEKADKPSEEARAVAIAYAARDVAFRGVRYEVDREDWGRYRTLVLADRSRDALAVLLEGSSVVQNVPLVMDDRALRYFERLRGRRELGLYAWATAELDRRWRQLESAYDETAEVLDGHRYRWVDELEPRQLLGSGPERIPSLFDHLESNCCSQIAISSQVCDDLLGFDFPRGDDGRGETRAHLMRRLWDAAGGEYVWSDLLQRYVPAAH